MVAAKLAEMAEQEEDPERARVTALVGWLVEYHRREEKPVWWQYFDRLEKTEEQLREDFDCLTGLVRTKKPRASREAVARARISDSTPTATPSSTPVARWW